MLLRYLVVLLFAALLQPAQAAPPPLTITLSKDVYYEIASDSQDKKYLEIRDAVLAANPEVQAFESNRRGDQITLTFGVGQPPFRADFRLFGSKHEFYRLSMGVRLADTLETLAKADPNITPAGAEKSDERVILRVHYAWPEEAAPPDAEAPAVAEAPAPAKTAPKPVPADKPVTEVRRGEVRRPPDPPAKPVATARNPKYFVPAKSSPYPTPSDPDELQEVGRQRQPAPTGADQPPAPPPVEAEAEVAVAAPASPPPTTAKPVVSEAPAAAPAAPKPQPPSPEAQAREAYQKALEAGTLQALVRFLEQHPDSAVAEQARAKAAGLREKTAYAKARERDDEPGYRGFLENFPDSEHKREVELRITTMEEARRRKDDDRRARAVEEKRRRAAYEQARNLNTPEAYRIFLTAYPDTSEAKQADKRLQQIEADTDAYRENSGSEAGLEKYLGLFPKGRYADSAREDLQALRTRRMEQEFGEATAAATPGAYRRFLENWPRSPRTREVRTALERLERGGPPPQEPAAPPPPARDGLYLVAPKVKAPPKTDGQLDDAAWGALQPLAVPLKGSAGSEQVRVRAVHDGSRLYLALEWNDRSRDALYRPWIWDPTAKTYHQNSQVDDAAAVLIYGTHVPEESCILQGQPMSADSWLWRAYLSEIAGQADDGVMRVSRERVPQSNPYPAKDGSGQLWVRRQTDNGTPGWSFFIPLEFQGSVVPSYRPTRAKGSRSDVTARGIWNSADAASTWTVEWERALDTGHADDQAFQPGQVISAAFAIFDKSEKGRHTSSPVVRIELQGR